MQYPVIMFYHVIVKPGLVNEVEGESYRHNGERHQPQYAHHDPEPLLSVGVALHHRPQALRPI